MRAKPSYLIVIFLILLLSIAPAMAANEPTGLSASASRYSIAWTWTANNTWYNTTVYIDGAYVQNISSPVTGTQTYTQSSLFPGTNHTISIRSTSLGYGAGNSSSWVNSSAYTLTTGFDVTNVTRVISDLGSILSALVRLLQTVIVDNIDIFVIIIVMIILLYIIKRFGWSFSDFFEGIMGNLFRK